MDYYSSQISKLIEQLSRLAGHRPQIRPAAGVSYHSYALENRWKQLSDPSIVEAKKNVRYCKECCTLTDQEVCPICANPKQGSQV